MRRGPLRQRAGHKALMDARLLREHGLREMPHHEQQCRRRGNTAFITGATTPESVTNIHGTDGGKSGGTACVYVMSSWVEEELHMFC